MTAHQKGGGPWFPIAECCANILKALAQMEWDGETVLNSDK